MTDEPNPAIDDPEELALFALIKLVREMLATQRDDRANHAAQLAALRSRMDRTELLIAELADFIVVPPREDAGKRAAEETDDERHGVSH
jgi:hypothetical protein